MNNEFIMIIVISIQVHAALLLIMSWKRRDSIKGSFKEGKDLVELIADKNKIIDDLQRFISTLSLIYLKRLSESASLSNMSPNHLSNVISEVAKATKQEFMKLDHAFDGQDFIDDMIISLTTISVGNIYENLLKEEEIK